MTTAQFSNMLTAFTPEQAAQELRQAGALQMCCDSREIQTEVAFVAWPGAAVDARRFVEAALQAGAPMCLVEKEGLEPAHVGAYPARILAYKGLRQDAGAIAAAFYGQPSQDLAVVAITGTNGKTSVSWWLAQACEHLSPDFRLEAGIVGTLGMGRLGALRPTGLTTPDPITLQSGLRDMVQVGVRLCALEASSIGIEQDRLNACLVDTAVFTNFTQDHLDYHGTMQAYWTEKEKLFAWPGLRRVVLHTGDAKGRELLRTISQRNSTQGQVPVEIWTYEVETQGQEGEHKNTEPLLGDRVRALRGLNLRYSTQGLAFEVQEWWGQEPQGDSQTMHTNVTGAYNVANLLAVMATLRARGVPLAELIRSCADLPAVPGRMQTVRINESAASQENLLPHVLVDYAHTPDALAKVLEAARPLAQARGGALVCVFGCGGNRDKSKRPLMAQVAQRLSDRVVLTSDNPRFEAPEAILQDMEEGLDSSLPRQHIVREVDRGLAIANAIAQADAQDLIVIAGKGHEDYQEIAGQRLQFDDVEQARRALALRAQRAELGGAQ